MSRDESKSCVLEIHAIQVTYLQEFSKCVVDSGMNGVVVAQTQTVEGLSDYLKSLEDSAITAFAGVELSLAKGQIVFIPNDGLDGLEAVDWTNGGEPWSNDTLSELIEKVPGILIASHPYFRKDESPMGDRIYRVKGLSAIVANRGEGPLSWDRLAQEAAQKHNVPALGSGGGAADNIGRAAIAVEGQVQTVSATRAKFRPRIFLISAGE